MRHVIVRRTAFLFGAALLACSAVFAWLVTPRQQPALSAPPPVTALGGAALFQSHCASCHSVEDLQSGVTDSEARRRELEQFLRDHGDASVMEDRLILDYLAADGPSGRRRD
jgi:mono/diheme cytochrome c family protein